MRNAERGTGVRTGSGSDRDAKFKSEIRIPQSQIGRPGRYRSRFWHPHSALRICI